MVTGGRIAAKSRTGAGEIAIKVQLAEPPEPRPHCSTPNPTGTDDDTLGYQVEVHGGTFGTDANRPVLTYFAAGSALMVFISEADTRIASAFVNLRLVVRSFTSL